MKMTNLFYQPDTTISMRNNKLKNRDRATLKEGEEPILPAKHHLDKEDGILEFKCSPSEWSWRSYFASQTRHHRDKEEDGEQYIGNLHIIIIFLQF